jgi:carbon storage regulator
MIGDDIEVSVLSVVGDKVRIGIQAPTAVPVFRTEIYLEIRRDKSRPRRGKVEPQGLEAAVEDALGDMRRRR